VPHVDASDMSVIDLRLKPAMLAHYNLPDIPYPISLAAFCMALSGDGELPFASMLNQLQMRSKDGAADWQSLEPAMYRLAELLTPNDPRTVLSASGEEWWIEVGPVKLDGPIVTIQRGDKLIAAMSKTDGGRLRVAAYRPFDAKSATYITGLAARPHSEHGVCMRENNWEYALDCSAGNGNFYAYMRGEAYLSYWENGIGLVSDGTKDANWLAMRELSSRPPAIVVTELGVYYSLSEDEAEPG
jgi:hypothetical protein